MPQGGKIVLDDGAEFVLTSPMLRFLCLGHMTAYAIAHDTFEAVGMDIMPRLDECHEHLGGVDCHALVTIVKQLMKAQLTPEQREAVEEFERKVDSAMGQAFSVPAENVIQISSAADLERALQQIFQGLREG